MAADPIEALLRAERHDRRTTFAMVGVSVVIGFVLTIVPFADGGRWPNLILPIVMAIVAVGLLRDALVRKPALVALLERPRDVVWIYLLHGPPGSKLMVALADGTTRPALVRPADSEWILPALAARFPHATVGWDLDLVAQYRRNPASLRRSAPP